MKTGPFRFWGKHDPTGREKAPILAELPSADVADGVAKMRLYDPIDSYGGFWGVSANEFAQALDELPAGTNQIELHLNSPGGEVYEGIAIMNALRNHPAHVTAIVDGLAASAASFIACAADELVMNPHTELMIHDAWGICIGAAVDMRDLADRLDHLSNNIASVYQRKGGGTVEDWRGAMLAETWYSADEAVAAGLADRVDDGESAASNGFDLTTFTYPGRAAAPAPTMPAAKAAAPAEPELVDADDRLQRLQARRARRHATRAA